MKPKTLRLLTIGIALLIFGPVIGWVLTMAGMFHTAATVQPIVPGAVPDPQQVVSRVFANFIPMLVGAVCGATGFFLVLYALIRHFWGSKA